MAMKLRKTTSHSTKKKTKSTKMSKNGEKAITVQYIRGILKLSLFSFGVFKGNTALTWGNLLRL